MRSPRRLAGPVVASAALHLLALLVATQVDWSMPAPERPLVVRIVPLQPRATRRAPAEADRLPAPPGQARPLERAAPAEPAAPAPPPDRPPQVARREPAQAAPRRTPAPVATPTPRAAPTPTPPPERPSGQVVDLPSRLRPDERTQRPPADTRYLSERNRVVERETVARATAGRPGRPPGPGDAPAEPSAREGRGASTAAAPPMLGAPPAPPGAAAPAAPAARAGRTAPATPPPTAAPPPPAPPATAAQPEAPAAQPAARQPAPATPPAAAAPTPAPPAAAAPARTAPSTPGPGPGPRATPTPPPAREAPQPSGETRIARVEPARPGAPGAPAVPGSPATPAAPRRPEAPRDALPAPAPSTAARASRAGAEPDGTGEGDAPPPRPLPGLDRLLPGPERLARLSPLDTARREGGGGTVRDYVPGVEQGEETFLNTREFRYTYYFTQVKRAIAQQWDPVAALRRAYPGGLDIGRDPTTWLLIVVEKDGRINRLEVGQASGVEVLDREALRAVRASGRFPAPPAGVLDSDGKFRFAFGFTVETGGGRLTFYGSNDPEFQNLFRDPLGLGRPARPRR